MKTQAFKKLIKEAVREVLQEVLFEEKKEQTVQKESFRTNGVEKTQLITSQRDPIMEMLNMTRNSMTSEDYKSMVGASSTPTFSNMRMEESNTPSPGLDISTLSFVKNAGAIYKASLEKDKQKLG
jgi:hypothetical protein